MQINDVRLFFKLKYVNNICIFRELSSLNSYINTRFKMESCIQFQTWNREHLNENRKWILSASKMSKLLATLYLSALFCILIANVSAQNESVDAAASDSAQCIPRGSKVFDIWNFQV